jgi:hypothetical protein
MVIIGNKYLLCECYNATSDEKRCFANVTAMLFKKNIHLTLA